MALRHFITFAITTSLVSSHGSDGQDFSGAMLIKDKAHLKTIATEATQDGGALFVRYMMRG